MLARDVRDFENVFLKKMFLLGEKDIWKGRNAFPIAVKTKN